MSLKIEVPAHNKPTIVSYSAHTTPIRNLDDDDDDDDDTLPSTHMKLNAASVSADNIDPPQPKQHHRHSRRSRSKFKLQNNTTREAGHTPPPRPSNHNIPRYGELVRDTNKKEGPINWWNLTLTLPDDKRMRILSPPRIPVPTTPTTPEYIVKTPDGLRVSLLDIDIDDEKKLNELGISVDDEKKEYILNLKKEQEKEEKEKQDKLNLDHNNSSESESTPDIDEFTAQHSIRPDPPKILEVLSQPLESGSKTRLDIKTRKRSKTPHDPSTPTLVTFDWDTIGTERGDDPYSLMDQYGNNAMTQEFYAGRISLQEMRLYQSAHASNSANAANAMHRAHSQQPTVKNRAHSFKARRPLLIERNHMKRHSEIIRSKSQRNRNKQQRIRKASRHKFRKRMEAKNLQRSASVGGPDNGKMLKDRTGKTKGKRNSSVHKVGKKQKKRKKPPKSEIITSRRAPKQHLEPIDLASDGMPYGNSSRKVRFRTTVEDDEEVVGDLIADILTANKENNNKDTPISIESHQSYVSNTSVTTAPDVQDADIDEEELEAPIRKAFGLKLQLDTTAGNIGNETKAISMPIMQLAKIGIKPADVCIGIDTIKVNTSQTEEEEREETEDNDNCGEEEEEEEEYEGDDSIDSDDDSYDYDYAEHRYSSSSGSSADNPGPLKNPFAIIQEPVINDDDDADGLPPKIVMPGTSNQLNLGFGGAVFIGSDGALVQNGAETVSNIVVRNSADKHLASSPLIMNNDDAVSSFFAQYIPSYYTSNPWMLSPTFEIAQYRDLKNLNLFIYKTLRLLARDDVNHPTQPRNIQMKSELDWDLRIDGIASCYITDELMTNVIHFVSFPRDFDEYNIEFNKKKKGKKHLLGLIKSTQSLVHNPVSPVTTKLKNGYSTNSNMMANSVTHTPRSARTSSKIKSTPNTNDDAYYENESDEHDNNLLIAANDRSRGCCCNVHNLRRNMNKNNLCDSAIYTLCYKYGDLLLFCAIYFAIFVFFILQRMYFPFYGVQSNIVLLITGRIMLISMILMFISRMISFQSFLISIFGHRSRFILYNFLCYPYIHLILSWFGIYLQIFIHIVCALLIGEVNLYDVIRIILTFLSLLFLILTNCGGTYYSLYSVSLSNKYLSMFRSVLCNISFDYGQGERRYKLLHIASGSILLIVFYLDINYIGVYYILSLFLFAAVLDRLIFLFNRKKCISSSDLNIIPIDHQFKILFVNNNMRKMLIEPGDIFYVSSSSLWCFARGALFFSKNNYASIGCILRVHRNNTLSHNMERVKWNFNFLEAILDNEIEPMLRGPYTNDSIYHKLIDNIHICHNDRYIQYLIAVDEGISYQIEYLTYLQSNNYKKMPYPTHIIFATTSKALFNYITTNLQLLFIELEDLTVECKLLPSNINLIPNIDEMISYYKNERIKKRKKLKQKQEEEDNINSNDILREMEYDILNYLSIPHILYHHNLKSHYENHKNSKLSKELHDIYYYDDDDDDKDEEIIESDEPNYERNDDIQIEMYYSGIPFVENCLKNVCNICRIPFYTQNIY